MGREGEWKRGERHSVVLDCRLTSGPLAGMQLPPLLKGRRAVSLRVWRLLAQQECRAGEQRAITAQSLRASSLTPLLCSSADERARSTRPRPPAPLAQPQQLAAHPQLARHGTFRARRSCKHRLCPQERRACWALDEQRARSLSGRCSIIICLLDRGCFSRGQPHKEASWRLQDGGQRRDSLAVDAATCCRRQRGERRAWRDGKGGERWRERQPSRR